MSTFKEITMLSPYNSQDKVLELFVDTNGDGYILENVIELIGTYTFSIWIKGNKNSNVVIDILGTSKAVSVTTQWQKISYIVDCADLTNKNIFIAPELNTTTYFYEGFLSQGNLEQSWLPAPEDEDDKLTSIRSEIVQTAESIEQKITASDGRITSLSTTVDGITGRIENAEGKVTTIEGTVNGLKTSVKDAEGNISTLQQTSKEHTQSISNINGDISQVRQDVGSVTTEVANARGDKTSLSVRINGIQSDVSNTKGEISRVEQFANNIQLSVKGVKEDFAKFKVESDKISSTVGEVKDNSITSSVEEFYKSTSPTTLIGGSWGVTQPTWENGKYIWRRTKITKGNGTTAYYPNENGLCITGNTGASGSSGKDGVGIGSVTNYYLASELKSGVTTSTPGWTTTVQTMDQNKTHLWNYEKISYTNGNTVSTTPCVIGTFGKNGIHGKDGVGISSIVEYYQISNSSTNAPTSWIETVPIMTPTNKYLWNYEKITYTDNTVHETAKRIIGIYGDRGLQGLQGINGKDGIAGKDGINGKTSYFHIKYSSVNNPTLSSQMSEAPNTYIGTYVDFIQEDSNDPSMYTWSKFIGQDGKNGIAGINGIDGKTSYLHIAYANSADGSNGFSTTDSTGKLYIGQYTDFIKEDSNNYKLYNWTKIKGENGLNGADGKGIKSITNYYLATPNGTGITSSSSGWTTTIQNLTSANKYLWNYEKITYTDSTMYQSTPCIIGTYGRDGADGQNGAAGVGISSIAEYYQISTSNTIEPTSWLTTVPQTTSVNKYLWNYEKITYTNNTFKETKKRVIGVYGDKGDKGQNGANGVGISKTEITYATSTSGTVIPNSSWGNTIPSVPSGQFLWTRTTVTYTDSKTSVSYSVSKNGINGHDGANGNGIKTAVATYQTSADGVNIPTGIWSSTIPKTEASKPYLWTRVVTTYTNGSSTTAYSVGSTIEGVSVGGKNLLLESSTGYVNSSYPISSYKMSEKMIEGEQYTCTIWGELGSGKQYFGLCLDGGNISLGSMKANGNGTYSLTFTGKGNSAIDHSTLYVYPVPSSDYSTSKISKIKLEKGNRGTDWTPAPDEYISNQYFDKVLNDKDSGIITQLKKARSEIVQLNNMISTLVIDENGESLMKQKGDSWEFSIKDLQQGISSAADDAAKANKDVGTANQAISGLQGTTKKLEEKTAVIEIKTYNGQPAIILGQSDSSFKLRITNTSIDFLDGAEKVAYISNQVLYITKTIIKDEIKIGDGIGWTWKRRENGNLGLRYMNQ